MSVQGERETIRNYIHTFIWEDFF